MATKKPNPDISVYDYMNSKGKNGSYATRKALFDAHFGGAYKGTAQQNLQLIKDLKEGKLSLDKAPDIKTPNVSNSNKTNTSSNVSTNNKITTANKTTVIVPRVAKKVIINDKKTTSSTDNIVSNKNTKDINSKTINPEYERLSKYSNGKKIDVSNGKISEWQNEKNKKLILTSTEVQARYTSGDAIIEPKYGNSYYQRENTRAKNPIMSDVIYKDNRNNLDLLKKSVNKKSKIKKISSISNKIIKDKFGDIVKNPKKYYYGKPLLDYAKDNFIDDVKKDLKKIFN